MSEYINALIYIGLGVLGAVLHYEKKRWIDKTTKINLRDYIFLEPQATVNALLAILAAEIPLSLAQKGDFIALAELAGAITAGYALDSSMNKAADKNSSTNTTE